MGGGDRVSPSGGAPTTSTMMFGHVDHPEHWSRRLRIPAGVQDPPVASPSRAASLHPHVGPPVSRRHRTGGPHRTRQPRGARHGAASPSMGGSTTCRSRGSSWALRVVAAVVGALEVDRPSVANVDGGDHQPDGRGAGTDRPRPCSSSPNGPPRPGVRSGSARPSTGRWTQKGPNGRGGPVESCQ